MYVTVNGAALKLLCFLGTELDLRILYRTMQETKIRIL